MKRWAKRIGIFLAAVLALVLLLAGGATLYALKGYRKTWDLPLPDTRASTDPRVIARGHYLVYGPAQCSDCHSSEAAKEHLPPGQDPPLTGGFGDPTFLGRWFAPNLTSDSITGIGAMSDGQIARLFRHGVNREGRLALPFKDAFANMSEADLIAIISYLRTLPPLPGMAPRKEPNILGKITLAYFLEPYSPRGTPPATVNPEPTAAYGNYLANTLARCESCHTPRNLKTGEFLGPPFSGGLVFHSREKAGWVFVSPNLTPDSATGHITAWTEETFLARMRAGAAFHDSPMPWDNFQRVSDNDLRAIYRYLRGLAPVRRDDGPTFRPEAGGA